MQVLFKGTLMQIWKFPYMFPNLAEIYVLHPNAAMTYLLLNITKLKLLAFDICIFNAKTFTCHVDYEHLTF